MSSSPAAAPGVVDCGEQRSVAAARCLVDAARARRVARLVETTPTAVSTYVTDRRGRTAVVTDSRRDPRGTHDVVLQTFRTTERRGAEILLQKRLVEVELWPPQPDVSLLKELAILRPLEVERDCGFRSPLVDRPELRGRPLAAVEEEERAAGRRVRVIGQDGTCNAATYDFSVTRTNVYLRAGLVVWAQMA